FPVRDRTMLLRVKITTLLRFEELRADRHRGPIPPEPPEKVGPTRDFFYPAGWRELGSVSLKIKAIAAGWNGPISGHAHLRGRSPEVQIKRRRAFPYFRTHGFREASERCSDRQPIGQIVSAVRRGMRLPRRELRGRDFASLPADDHSSPSKLRRSVVGGHEF